MKNKKAEMSFVVKILLWAAFFALILFSLYVFLRKLGVL